jgi:hypothetical protein
MRFNKFVLSGLTALAGLGMASDAFAGGRNPGSLLLVPEFDNRNGTVTILTVTNTSADAEVDIEYVYQGRYAAAPANSGGYELFCEEFNRTETLTPNDTLTLITNFHNPQHEQGYVYIFAKENGLGSVHNALIGQVMTVDGIEAFEYAVNCVTYAAVGGDVDGDSLQEMDGVEYEASVDEILIPRFFGQRNGMIESELIFIGLTGGAAFETTVDFLIYNDNEEVFSSEYTFYCWDRVRLLRISGIFDNDFLHNYTNDDMNELLGADNYETGWFRMQGALASSSATTILDPAIYAVLIEKIGNRGAADLPFENGLNENGALLARGVFGQN